MQTQQAPASPSPARANRYRGPCSICRTFVAAGRGTYLGRLASGGHDIRCSAHTDASASNDASTPPSNASAPSTPPSTPPGPERPNVSRTALDAAMTIYRHACRDPHGPEGARDLAWEIVTAVAFVLGVTVDREAVRVATRSRTTMPTPLQAAADDLVSSILDRPEAAPVDAPERREAAHEAAERTAVQTPAPAPAAAPKGRTRTSKPRTSKAGDLWTNRRK